MATRSRNRFNLLLLDEGEYLLEECSVTMLHFAPSSGPEGASDPMELESKQRGRLRVCTRGLFFEPEEAKLPIIKLPFNHMPGKPLLLPTWPHHASVPQINDTMVTDALNPKDALMMQPAHLVEMKAGGFIGPYKTLVLEDDAAAVTESAGKDKRKAAQSKKSDSKSLPNDYGTHSLNRHTYVFVTMHISGSQIITLLQQLWGIQVACRTQTSADERLLIEPIIAPRRDGPFTLSLLGDYRERPLLPATPQAITVERVFPMVSCPGRIMLTEKALYFQPIALNNVAGADPVVKWMLRDIKRVMRRTRLQRQVGMELILHESAVMAASNTSMEVLNAGLRAESASSATVFFAFQSVQERDAVYQEVLTALRERVRPSKDITDEGSSSFHEFDDQLGDISPDMLLTTTRNWQLKKISNLEYLEFLNLVAGRTYADLTQYPVMPWIIQDYTSKSLDLTDEATFRDLSKPIGALNAARLERLKERYESMPHGAGAEPPFLYGTHYSTPGYCLYYMVRSMPEQMLRLQAGRFDAADRLFVDVSTAWNGVVSLNMDVKELIPEFYKSDGTFLLIPDGLDLGVRQNGRRVADVGLPPWAFDAGDFIQQMRNALECDYVSGRIHHWIDLIFGHKQRGAAAEEADNLFYYMTYDGAVDIENISDPTRRHAIQQQIAEFGQTPKQIFTAPHPMRTGPPIALPLAVARSQARKAAEAPVAAVAPASQAEQPAAKPPSFANPITSAWEGELPAAPARQPACGVCESMVWNKVHFSSMNDSLGDIKLHSEYITGLSACSADMDDASEGIQAVSASRDGTIRVFGITLNESATLAEYGIAFDGDFHPRCSLAPDKVQAAPTLSQFLLFFTALNPTPTTVPVSAVAMTDDKQFAICGSWDGNIHIFNVSMGVKTLTLNAHNAPISSLSLVHISSEDECCSYALFAGSWDTTVSVWYLTERYGSDRTVSVVDSCIGRVSDHSSQVTSVAGVRAATNVAYLLSGDASAALMWHKVSFSRVDDVPKVTIDIFGVNGDLSADALSAKGDLTGGGLSGITATQWCPVQSPVIAFASSVDGKVAVMRCSVTVTPLGRTSSFTMVGIIATGDVIRSLAVFADGSAFATGGNSGVVQLWSLKQMYQEGNQNDAIILTRDETLMATLSLCEDSIAYGAVNSELHEHEDGAGDLGTALSGMSGMRRGRTSIRLKPEEVARVSKAAAAESTAWPTALAIVQTPSKVVVLSGSKVGQLHAWVGIQRSSLIVEEDDLASFSISRARE